MSKTACIETPAGSRAAFKPDAWLAAIVGHEVFQIILPSEGVVGIEQQDMVDAARDGNAFCFAKVGTLRMDQVHALTLAGFNVVDVNVSFERKPGRIADASPVGSVVVRDIRQGERDTVLDIAASSFVYSRMHLDPLIPNRIANEVRRAWVENYIEGRRGERLLVALRDGEPAGFLAVLAASINGKSARVIDLIAVDKPHQGRGVGRALVNGFINECDGVCDVLRVGTQVSNIPSMRLYEQCGFQIVETAYVLHAHVAHGRILK